MSRKLRIELEPDLKGISFQYHFRLFETWVLSDKWYATPKLAVCAAVRLAKKLNIPFDIVIVYKHPNPEICKPAFQDWLHRHNIYSDWGRENKWT